MNFLGCVQKSMKQDICLVYNCHTYIYIRYMPIFHVVSDVCSCKLAVFHEAQAAQLAHHSNQQVYLMNI